MDIKDLENTSSNKKMVANNNRKQSIEALLQNSTKLQSTFDNLQKTLNSSLGFTSLKNLYDNESLIKISETYSNPQYQKILNNITTDIYLKNINPTYHQEIKKILASLGESYAVQKTLYQNFNFEHLKGLSKFLSPELYKSLAYLKNSPFPLFENENFESTSEFEINYVKIFELEPDSETKQDILDNKDFNKLAPKTRYWISFTLVSAFLMQNILIPYFVTHSPSPSELQSLVTGFFAFESNDKTDSSESIKNFYEQCLSSSGLKNCLTITAHSVNLRQKPNMKSDVIITLPINKLVKSIDKSDKSWLLVRAEIDGQTVEGWVLRRYTDNLR